MPPELLALLFDIDQCCELVRRFTTDKSIDDFRSDVLLRSAVERQFITIGEALQQGLKVWPELAEHISDFRRIVNFRNVMVHGYARISVETVWGVVDSELAILHSEIKVLRKEC
jgi:uncharacterized protein with HEPN domain